MAISKETKKSYINTDNQAVKDTINQAAAILGGTTYIPGQEINSSYWATSGGGGKNALHGNTSKDYKAQAWTATDYAAAQKIVDDYNAAQEQQKALAQQQQYDQMMNNMMMGYQTLLGQQQAQQQEQYQQAQQLTAGQINQAYDQSARDYYRLYKTQQKSLPENLSKAGVTGGASESSQLKLMNSYSDNLANNEMGRNAQLTGNAIDYNNKVAENSKAYASQLGSAYLQMVQQTYNYQLAERQRQQELQAEKEKEIAAQQAAAAVTSWNNQQYSDMEKALAKGKTIWTWTDSNGQIQWTDSEAKGLAMGGKKRSPSSAKQTKKVNDDDEDVKPTENTSVQSSYDYKTLEMNMTNALLRGASKSQLQTFVDPIEAAYNAGSITEKEARKLLDMLK